MARRKSTESKEAKNLRQLLLSIGLSSKAAEDLITQADGRYADLSARACEVEMYIAAHPEVKNHGAYAAATLKNFADEQHALSAAMPTSVQPAAVQIPQSLPTMELWGDEEQ